MIVLVWMWWACVVAVGCVVLWKLGVWLSKWWSGVPKASTYPGRTFRPDAEPDPFPPRPLVKTRPISAITGKKLKPLRPHKKAKRGKKKP
jgi:hypothetical protein